MNEVKTCWAPSERDNTRAVVVPTRVSAITLAAGKAERLGFNKLSLRLAGRSIVNHVVNTALASQVTEVVVVLGHYVDELSAEIPRDGRVKVVHNPHHEEGPHSSLKAGLIALNGDAEAAVVLLGDQPFVDVQAIDALIGEWLARRPSVVMPLYKGKRGHPVLFSRTLFRELLEVSEEQGRREVIRRHYEEVATVTVDGEPPLDVDTWTDYLRLAGKAERHSVSSGTSNDGEASDG